MRREGHARERNLCVCVGGGVVVEAVGKKPQKPHTGQAVSNLDSNRVTPECDKDALPNSIKMNSGHAWSLHVTQRLHLNLFLYTLFVQSAQCVSVCPQVFHVPSPKLLTRF
jgi:hypothetical protein